MIRIFKTSLSSSSDSPEVLTAESGQQTSPGRRGIGRKSSGRRSPGGGASFLSNKRLTLPFLAFVAVLAAGLLFMLPGGLLQAQEPPQSPQQSVEYAEDRTDPVLTLSASDPESVTPIVWSLLDDATGNQNLGIFTDDGVDGGTENDGIDDNPNDDVAPADIADRDDFMISQNGELTFKEDLPNYESPTDREVAQATGSPVTATPNDYVYHVVVQASDGGTMQAVNWFKVTVTVQDVEEKEKVTWDVDADGDGTEQTPGDLQQFQPGAILTANTPTGGDGSVTNVNWKWYRSSSRSETGGTQIIDSATDQFVQSRSYTVSDTSGYNDVGMYIRAVATYTDNRGPGKTASFVSHNPVQPARDDNTAPRFASASATRIITENSEGNVGGPIRAPDADGDILTYSLLEADAANNDNASFSIDPVTGQLKVGKDMEPDFESPDDALGSVGGNVVQVGTPPAADTAGNNIYVVTLKATDSSGGDSGTVAVAITVTDLNEKPVFRAGDRMWADLTEGMTAIDRDTADGVQPLLYTAFDPEGGTVTLSLMGDDAGKFMLGAGPDPCPATDPAVPEGITPTCKELSLNAKPDFEMPGDMNGDNIYQVTVQASDGAVTADRDVTVKVIDTDEAGKVKLSPSQDALINAELTAMLTDSDGGVPTPGQFTDQKWMWLKATPADEVNCAAIPYPEDAADDARRWTAVKDADKDSPSHTYTPTVDDRGDCLRAMVTYTDRTRDEDNDAATNTAALNFVGFRNMVTSDVTTAVRNNPDNQRPKFAEGASTFRVVAENTPPNLDDDNAATTDIDESIQGNVGGPVTATDDDSDTPSYSLSGADAKYFEVSSSGQIEVGATATLNYESKNVYRVKVIADDGFGAPNSTASIDVTIHVADLDEKPVIMDRADRNAMGQQSVEYAEDRTDPVLTLSASDPESVTPIVWSLLDDATGNQNLGIFTDDGVDGGTENDGIDDNPNDDVAPADIADRDDFMISQNGELTFKEDLPNYESPTDREVAQATGSPVTATPNDYVYHVVVQASDGGTMQAVNWFKVTVTVQDVEEKEKVTWDVDADGDGTEQTPGDLQQFSSAAILTANTPTGGDGSVTNVNWKWYRSSSRSETGGTQIIDSNGNPVTTLTYEVSDTPGVDIGKYIRLEATYDDGYTGNSNRRTASFVSHQKVQQFRENNTAPRFASASVTRRITENSEGNVGGPIRATDADGDILTYSLLEADAANNDNASFSIDPVTGQLKVGKDMEPNFESPTDAAGSVGGNAVMVGTPPAADTAGNNIYVVTLKATDSSGGDSGTVAVAITVTDLNEKPVFRAGAKMWEDLTEGMTAIDRDTNTDGVQPLLYTAFDPEGGTVTLSLMGDDADMFMLGVGPATCPDTTPAVPTGITPTCKELSLNAKPDFEDAGGHERGQRLPGDGAGIGRRGDRRPGCDRQGNRH